MPESEPVRICFVCLGNICRSPTAEGVMESLVRDAGLRDRIQLDSAGTGAWHAGERADDRARAEARRRGIDLTSRARQFRSDDFASFDLILGMDERNLVDIRALAPDDDARARASLLRSFDPLLQGAAPYELAVPDPYFGENGFVEVFDMIDAACRGLLEHIRATML